MTSNESFSWKLFYWIFWQRDKLDQKAQTFHISFSIRTFHAFCNNDLKYFLNLKLKTEMKIFLFLILHYQQKLFFFIIFLIFPAVVSYKKAFYSAGLWWMLSLAIVVAFPKYFCSFVWDWKKLWWWRFYSSFRSLSTQHT